MDAEKLNVLIFDLDGTLYEDTHHFDYQAERLKERLPFDKQAAFQHDYNLTKTNDHPLKIGRIYDVIKGLILVQVNNHVTEAYEWNGRKLSKQYMKQLYPRAIELNFETMLSVGDPWWISISIAAHYGLDSKSCYDAFLETRAYMMKPEFIMKPVPNFKETLEAIHRTKKLVLLTNSPEPDSMAILTKLGLESVFDLKIFDGMKPTMSQERFEYIRSHFNVTFDEIISIGDNWVNDIRPAKELGCMTIFIDYFQLDKDGDADETVRNIREMISLLQKLI